MKGQAAGRGRAEVHPARPGRRTRTAEHHRAYAIRAAWLEEGGAPYLASLRIDQAASWAEFREACRYLPHPVREHGLGRRGRPHRLAGRGPGAACDGAGTGCCRCPGDGRYEWDGFLPVLDLPHLADPPRGWFASANQDNLPPRLSRSRVGFQWTDPFRFARIEEVLGSGRRFTLTDMMQLQQDELSLPARSLVPLLRGLKPASDRARQAVRPAAGLGLRARQGLGRRPRSMRRGRRHVKAAVRELMVPDEARDGLPGPLRCRPRS